MTEREILEEKTKVFSERECVNKLIEELWEAMKEAIMLDAALSVPSIYTEEHMQMMLRTKLMEELADVDVAGRRTLELLYQTGEWTFNEKSRHGVRVQLREAIELRKKHLEHGNRVYNRRLFRGI